MVRDRRSRKSKPGVVGASGIRMELGSNRGRGHSKEREDREEEEEEGERNGEGEEGEPLGHCGVSYIHGM